MAMYALLRLIKKCCGVAGSRDSAAEYWEMASSCCSALIAASPRPSSFNKQRRLKSSTQGSYKRLLPYSVQDRSPRIHSARSSCAFVCSASSSTIRRKHSLASVMRSIAASRSHMTRYIVNLGIMNSKEECQVHGGCQSKRNYLHQKQPPRHPSMSHKPVLPLTTLERATWMSVNRG